MIVLTSKPIIYNKQGKIKKVLVDNTKKTIIKVRVSPGASKNEVTGFRGDSIKMKIAAPPVKGKANKELINYLSGLLGIKRGDIIIISGQTKRNKTLAVSGLDREVIVKKLSVKDKNDKKRGFQSEISW